MFPYKSAHLFWLCDNNRNEVCSVARFNVSVAQAKEGPEHKPPSFNTATLLTMKTRYAQNKLQVRKT